MTVTSPLLQRLDMRLPLDGLDWSGEGRQAAVLVALSDEVEPLVLLGRRNRELRLHPGEIAFPGGKREPADASPWITARREALEEVGMQPAKVHPLGELSPLFTRSGYQVHPCIARVPPRLELRVDRREFDSTFLAPLASFADRDLFRLEPVEEAGQRGLVPHYHLGEDDIWGATAAILAQLANLACDAGLEIHGYWETTP